MCCFLCPYERILLRKALGFMQAAVLHYYPGFEVTHKRQCLVSFLNFIQMLHEEVFSWILQSNLVYHISSKNFENSDSE